MKYRNRLFQALILAGLIFLLPPGARAETLTGEASFTPWSGYWWPITRGELVWGYRRHPSPLEKYDLYTSGDFPAEATAWEKQAHYDPDAVSWAGYCHAWVNASILEEIDFSPSSHKGIFFAVGDKKGLMTLAHANDPQSYGVCIDDPTVFHRYLLEYIGDNGIAIAADLDNSEQFWSYPIYRYEMEVTSSVVQEDGVFVQVDDVSCFILYADDFVDPDYQGTEFLFSTYEYRLYKDSDDNYTTGVWTGRSVGTHPEVVWIPVSQRAENPYLDYDTIRSLAVARDDEVEGQTDLAPGHYSLVVNPGEEDSFTIELPGSSSFDLALAMDAQNPAASSAGYEIKWGDALVSSGEIGETLQSLSVSVPEESTYQITIVHGGTTETAVFVHLYLDITLAETVYLPSIPNSYYWLGMALGNSTDQANRFYAAVMKDNGLPVASAPTDRRLQGRAKWTGVVDREELPFDYLTTGDPMLVKITSEYPLDVLEMIGNDNTLHGPPLVHTGTTTGARELVIPTLTKKLSLQQSARLFLYNGGSEEIAYRINYFRVDGEAAGEETLTISGKSVENYPTGDYPGNKDLNGWALVNDYSGQLRGKLEIQETSAKKDDLPLLEVGTRFYLPHLLSGYGWETTLTLFNVSDQENLVVLSCFDGEQDGETIAVALTPHEKRELVLDFVTLGLSAEQINQTWIQVDAPASIAGFISYRYDNAALASLPLFQNKHFSTNKNLCHVVSDEMWWTGVVLLNPNPEPVEVTFVGYDSQGIEVGRTGRTIESGKKLAELGLSLFPYDFERVGSINIEATLPVTGLAAYGPLVDFDLLAIVVLE